MKTDSQKICTTLYCTATAEGLKSRMWLRVADPCVEPYLFDVLDVFVSPVATVSITFSGPLETLPLSFLLFAARFSLCYTFVYVLHISVFAARFCNVLCCEIDEDVFLLCLCFDNLHVFS